MAASNLTQISINHRVGSALRVSGRMVWRQDMERLLGLAEEIGGEDGQLVRIVYLPDDPGADDVADLAVRLTPSALQVLLTVADEAAERVLARSA